MESTDKPIHIIIISMIVFIVLNIIENLIYYNNGKYGLNQQLSTYFTIPKFNVLIRMALIMLCFAFAQGFFTMVFSNIYK